MSSDGSEEQQERPGMRSKKAKTALFASTDTAEALRGLEEQQRIKNQQFADYMLFNMLHRPLSSIPEEDREDMKAVMAKYSLSKNHDC